MTWLVWRQHRNQAYLAAAILAAFAVLLLVTGTQMASQYQSAAAACAGSHNCGVLLNGLTLGNPVLFLLVTLTILVPCLLGLFWGGPLVAREIETGTSQFAWMQSITRRRWLAVKVGWALLAAAAWGGAVSALVTWWSSPLNALNHENFNPGQFDTQGIVPVGYALFAVALGIAAGAVVRRTLPALAITLFGFAAVRIVIASYVRPHYLAPLTRTFPLGGGTPTLSGSYWQISQGLAGPGGQAVSGAARGGPSVSINGVALSGMPSACQKLVFQNPLQTISCLNAHGYRGLISYQPAGRFWAFQGIETGIFVGLAAILVAVTAVVVLRRDA
jgi:ABC-type transport system involved in multi-copper enzyme maturation permease subunit